MLWQGLTKFNFLSAILAHNLFFFPLFLPQPVFVNKVLLEHGHVHSFRPWLLLMYKSNAESCDHKLNDPQSLKYLY